MKKYFPSIILFVFLFISCNDNPVVDSDNSFSVDVRVVDIEGKPLHDINVSMWAKVNFPTLNKISKGNEILSSTTIQFTLPELCFAKLVVYDMKDEVIDTLLHSQLQTGNYAVQWIPLLHNRVFKCKLTTSTDSLQNNILYESVIYMIELSPDPSLSSLGKSDHNGVLTINDKFLFPQFFNLPLIHRTNAEGPEPISDIRFLDSVVIVLTDTTFSNPVYYNCHIKNGKNNFTLTWDETLAKSIINDESSEKLLKHNDNSNVESVILDSFTATVVGNDVFLNWQTSYEQNNQGFEIQRWEVYNQSWIAINFIQGSGTTNEPQSYTFKDSMLPNNQTYKYRLKQIDFDGSFEYSNEIEVGIMSPTEFKLFQNYPNPFN